MSGLESIGEGPVATGPYGPFGHKLLRHASAVSTAIANNLSMEVGHPSQLVNPSNAFEESHRHYSFIAMLAMMSLFLLITISITGLMLGFCRKKNYPKSEGSKMDGSSQFELNDIDMEVETKMRKGDPHCYYHLSDDDEDDDAFDDDDDNGACVKEKRRKKEARRHERKWKRLRDRGYYYHLYANDDDEDSWDERECYAGDSHGSSGRQDGGNSDAPDSARELLPKRSTTCPQLHNVRTTCMSHDIDNAEYQKLQLPPKPIASRQNNVFSSGNVTRGSAKDVQASSSGAPTRCTCEISSQSQSSSSSSHTHAHQQHQHVHACVQIVNPNGSCRSPSDDSSHSPARTKSIRNRHAQQMHRQARKQRQPSHQLHHQQQKKLRPSHLQHYSSLSYHRHARLHHAIKHSAWSTQKRRVPVAWPDGGGRGLLYKSHSIHAIPCSELTNEERRKSALDSTLKSSAAESQVQITVERVDYSVNDKEEDISNSTCSSLLANENG